VADSMGQSKPVFLGQVIAGWDDLRAVFRKGVGRRLGIPPDLGSSGALNRPRPLDVQREMIV